MPIAVGLHLAEEFHRACVLGSVSGEALAGRRVDDDPRALDGPVAEMETLVAERPARVGMEVVGGIAALGACVPAEAGHRLVHVPGAAGRADERTRCRDPPRRGPVGR